MQDEKKRATSHVLCAKRKLYRVLPSERAAELSNVVKHETHAYNANNKMAYHKQLCPNNFVKVSRSPIASVASLMPHDDVDDDGSSSKEHYKIIFLVQPTKSVHGKSGPEENIMKYTRAAYTHTADSKNLHTIKMRTFARFSLLLHRHSRALHSQFGTEIMPLESVRELRLLLLPLSPVPGCRPNV